MVLKYILITAGAFGRRASDGGANLHIYYPTSTNISEQPVGEVVYGSQATHVINPVPLINDHPMPAPVGPEITDDSSDEIQR